MAATYTRRNIYNLGGDWADPILWYARGVKAMGKRALNEKLSWRFFAGIHGFDQQLWTDLGQLSASDPMPTQADFDRFWEQCQHQTWYFLPWHRGYLLALEATIRDAVVSLGGPSDWALPYWNYFGPNGQYKLPPAFASPDWPDGKGDNPLYRDQRYGPKNDGNVYVPLDQVNLDALKVGDFTGVAGGDAGFGGLDTGFSHYAEISGDLEGQPHNRVHTRVGGQNLKKKLPGLMSDPDSAGLDPIFYLHHANIDRLWEVWIRGPVSLGNPTETNWLGGPVATGERGFSMPLPPKGDPWDYVPADMADLSKLDYVYDDVSSPAVVPPGVLRLTKLGISPAAFGAPRGGAAMSTAKGRVELVGANDAQPMRFVGSGDVRTAVRLDKTVQQKVGASLADVVATTQEPDRVFLNLKNVRGLNDATTFNVYVDERLAGNISLFGVRRTTIGHGQQGHTFVLEITNIIDELHLQGGFDADKLEIRIEPLAPVAEEAQVSIGSVSIVRQGR